MCSRNVFPQPNQISCLYIFHLKGGAWEGFLIK